MKAKSLFMIIHDFYSFDNLLFIRKFLQACVFYEKPKVSHMLTATPTPVANRAPAMA